VSVSASVPLYAVMQLLTHLHRHRNMHTRILSARIHPHTARPLTRRCMCSTHHASALPYTTPYAYMQIHALTHTRTTAYPRLHAHIAYALLHLDTNNTLMRTCTCTRARANAYSFEYEHLCIPADAPQKMRIQ
jgi:hypothetical protein